MATTPKAPRYVQTIRMGLGEAVKRLIQVEFQFRTGTGSDILLEERKMILEAMDHIPIEIGFDCNSDGVPDSVAIFQQAAVTSCCRLLPYETSRRTADPPAKRPRSSRRQPEMETAPPPPVPPEPTIPEEVVPTPPPPKKKFLGIFGKDK